MDFELTDEQRMFRDVLRDFVEARVRPVARDWEQAGREPDEIVDEMKSMGLFGLLVPKEYGGLGAGMAMTAIAFEEISRGWMGLAGTIGTHSAACWMIATHGTQAQRARYLPELATGQRRSGLGLTEPAAGTDLQGIRTRARLDGDCYVVEGTKTWITSARHADPLPVLVKTDTSAEPRHHGMSILLVEQDTPGLRVARDLGKLGYRGVESCEVVLDAATVPVANLLGGVEGRGLQHALTSLATGRINIAARAVGVSQAAYEAAMAYADEREAFGRPIGAFQAIQHKLADMATGIQASRLLTYWAATRFDRDGEAELEAAMAKLHASEHALRAALESMRIHGGYGYSTEFEVERYYRDAPLMAIGEGTNEVLRTVIARRLQQGPRQPGGTSGCA